MVKYNSFSKQSQTNQKLNENHRLPLTALAMLEHNAGHYPLAIDSAQRAVKVHRQFYGAGTRLEVEGIIIIIIIIIILKKEKKNRVQNFS